MKKLKNILIQFAISFTVLWSVFVWYAAWNDVVNDGDSLTHTMWNDLVTQVGSIPSSPVLKWYISWLTLSNDSWDLNNDIQIETWIATSSDSNQYIDLTSVMTKRLDAGWSAWDNAGWLATGSKASNTWYHVFVIRRNDWSVDAWFDTSVTATNLLSTSGYNKYRRIGSINTNWSANIRGFHQLGNRFFWDTIVLDRNQGNPWTSAVLSGLTTPAWINTMADLSIEIVDVTFGWTSYHILVTSPDSTNEAPTATNTHVAIRWVWGSVAQGSVSRFVKTNTSSQVRFRTNYSNGDTSVIIMTQGFIDDRIQ